jgi:hypothetical protein
MDVQFVLEGQTEAERSIQNIFKKYERVYSIVYCKEGLGVEESSVYSRKMKLVQTLTEHLNKMSGAIIRKAIPTVI